MLAEKILSRKDVASRYVDSVEQCELRYKITKITEHFNVYDDL